MCLVVSGEIPNLALKVNGQFEKNGGRTCYFFYFFLLFSSCFFGQFCHKKNNEHSKRLLKHQLLCII